MSCSVAVHEPSPAALSVHGTQPAGVFAPVQGFGVGALQTLFWHVKPAAVLQAKAAPQPPQSLLFAVVSVHVPPQFVAIAFGQQMPPDKVWPAPQPQVPPMQLT